MICGTNRTKLRNTQMVVGTHIQDGTARGLMFFLDQAPKKNWIQATTAKSYKAAVAQILQVIADDLGEIDDVRKIDVETVLGEFEDARGHDYTEGSLASYKTRFRRAIEMYVQFLDDPKSLQEVQPRVRGERPSAADVTDLREAFHATTAATMAMTSRAGPPAVPRVDELIEYPFPLSDGGTAYLRLPRLISAADVDRLTAFLKSIAIDPRGQTRLPLDLPQPN